LLLERNMNCIRIFVVAGTVGCFASDVRAQGFNVDIDVPGIPQYAGGDPPSAAFGAASGQTGYWNSVPTIHQGTLALRDLGGNATGVQETMTGASTDLAYAFAGNTGDYAALLNDGVRIGASPLTYTLTGFAPGLYRVFTYSVKPNGEYGEADISVSSSTSPNPQRVSGIMPGNQFQYGLTHSIHDLQVTDGSFVITATGPWPNGFISGFQIVPVPEPCTVLALSTGALVLIRRRRVRT
jgi:hypothetical protein